MVSWLSKLIQTRTGSHKLGCVRKRMYTETEPTQRHSERGPTHDNIFRKSNRV